MSRSGAAESLGRILEAIDRIERYTAEMAFQAFAESDLAQDAVIRNLEVVGAACEDIARSEPDFAARHPDFPLTAAVETRDGLADAGFGVDIDTVWRTIQTLSPEMRRQARAIVGGASAG